MRLTLKAARDLASLGAGLDVQDACDVLGSLAADDFSQRLQSESTTEWMYVFKPTVAGVVVYLKVTLRAECLVVSFHEDGEEGERDHES